MLMMMLALNRKGQRHQLYAQWPTLQYVERCQLYRLQSKFTELHHRSTTEDRQPRTFFITVTNWTGEFTALRKCAVQNTSPKFDFLQFYAYN